MANVLVTGGAGFIGSHLATQLVESGHRVRVLDDLSTGHRENLDHISKSVELMEADMRDRAVCDAACNDMDYVFHEAAVASVPRSIHKPEPSHDANINGTFYLLQASVKHKVRRFIYAASSSAYGDSDVSPKHEDLPTRPLSPYAVQKLTGEHYLRVFYECFGLQTISLRYFNVFGSRQDPESDYAAAIPAFVSAILRGGRPTVFGDGEQTRDFTYIDNVVHGNLLAMQVPDTHGEVVNIACGGQISVNEVIARINEALGSQVEAHYVAARVGDVRHSCADIQRARDLLGYEPQVSFGEGLQKAIRYYRSLVS